MKLKVTPTIGYIIQRLEKQYGYRVPRVSEQRLAELEEMCADPNLKMWDGSRETIEVLCAEIRRLQEHLRRVTKS